MGQAAVFQIQTGISAPSPAHNIAGTQAGRGKAVPPAARQPVRKGRVGNGHSGGKRSTRGRTGALVSPGVQRITRGPYAGDVRRPKQDRQQHMVFDQQRELINALDFAESVAPRLDTFMTILWRHRPGFDDKEWVKLERLMWVKICQWLRVRGVEHRCIWVREWGRQKGPHLHALLRVPTAMQLEFRDYLVSSYGLLQGGVIIKASLSGKQHVGLLRYLMKGSDRRDFRYRLGETVNVNDLLGIEHRGTAPPINVQRCGVTRNLGPSARRDSGFRDRRHLEDVADRITTLEGTT